jgi:hypothetical protein
MVAVVVPVQLLLMQMRVLVLLLLPMHPILLLCMLLVVLVVMLPLQVCCHVRAQVQLQAKLHALADFMASAKEVKALEVHREHVGRVINADALVRAHLQAPAAQHAKQRCGQHPLQS